MSKFLVGDKVRMTADYKSEMAVPVGQEGRVVEVGVQGAHIVVDFGHPWGERGCRAGESLEMIVDNDLLSSVATAIDAEVYRQYQAGDGWEEAKDVLECLDYCDVAAAALRAAQAWKDRQ